MRQKHQPDVSFQTRHGRYYRTWDPDYRPKPTNKIKKIVPEWVKYSTFQARVKRLWVEKALEMWLPKRWGDRSMYMKSYKYKEH